MNYWPAEVGNLPECHLPLFDLIDGSSRHRRAYGASSITARGIRRPPQYRFMARARPSRHPCRRIWPMGGSGLVQHLWDHFEYNPDLDFLRVRAYPAMKEAARFVMDFLVEPERRQIRGLLVTNPSYSPENAYGTASDRRRHLTTASTMDLQLIRETCSNVV